MDGGLFLLAIGVAVIPFVLPIVSLVRASRTARRLDDLEHRLNELQWLLDVRTKVDSGSAHPEAAPTPVAPSVAFQDSAKAEPHEAETAQAFATAAKAIQPDEGGAPVAPPPAELAADVFSPAETQEASPAPEPERLPSISAPGPKIEWERWLGVRGAAVLGAAVLGLAALLFFKYSIEHGLISPTLRVVMGILVGLGCLISSEWLQKKFTATANALAGGGTVVLYGAFWAAKVLYQLIGMELTFGLMVLTTATACLFAVRRNAMVIALLGLVGGFATPLLLASGSDRPIGLFGYILLLDAGLLIVAHKKQWPWVALFALLGTVLIQGLWIGVRMGPERLALGLAILGVFALVFLFALRRSATRSRNQAWLATQVGAVLLPFGFGLYFAGSAQLGAHLYPIALLLALLLAAACWLAQQMNKAALSQGAASATLAVIAVWFLAHGPVALAWEVVLVCIGLALVTHVFLELERLFAWPQSGLRAALILEIGLFVLALLVAVDKELDPPWPWIVEWAVLTALLYRQASFGLRTAKLQIIGAVLLALGFVALSAHCNGLYDAPLRSLILAVEVALAIGLLIMALLRRTTATRQSAEHGAAIFPLIIVLALPLSRMELLSEWVLLGGSTLLAMIAISAETRAGRGAWLCVAGAALAIVHTAWTRAAAPHLTAAAVITSLLMQLVAMLVIMIWPILAAPRFRQSRWAFYASALAAPAWFWSLRQLFETLWGNSAIGVLPLSLAVITMGTMIAVLRLAPVVTPLRKTILVWYSAVALGLISIAIPLQLEKEWLTIGWALEGLALIMLWQRLDHPGLKWFAVALACCVSFRLIDSAEVLEYQVRGGWPILNWLLYTYWVPILAQLGMFRLLAGVEVSRARPWEQPFYSRGHALGAIAIGLLTIVLVFVWINVAIADWFSVGREITLSFAREPAKDLTTSIAWGLYAIVLLALGMARSARGLRWISLGFLILTIGKVFLYDLGQLRDLYRVLSLLGLAVSLIAVSLAYQRFVFRKEKTS